MPKSTDENDTPTMAVRAGDRSLKLPWFRPMMVALTSLILAAAGYVGVLTHSAKEDLQVEPAKSGQPPTAGQTLATVAEDLAHVKSDLEKIEIQVDPSKPGWRALADARFDSIEAQQKAVLAVQMDIAEAINENNRRVGKMTGEISLFRGELAAYLRQRDDEDRSKLGR